MEHIKKHIEERLWAFIKRSYNSEDYKTAILDSIQFIGDVIRDKSGLDSDGNQLVGSAFGGPNPKIKLNKLKTESEKNIQKGIASILRGIYSAYRNPRSHAKVEDTEKDAFEIIIFLNHLLKLVDKSKGKFSIDRFLQRIFDKDFVKDSKCVGLIIKDVPKNKIFEVAIEIFKQKKRIPINNLKYIWEPINKHLTEESKKELILLVSEELRYTNSLEVVTRCIALFEKNWEEIDEDSRYRAENKLIKIITEASEYINGDHDHAASYLSWLPPLIEVSLLKPVIAEKVYESLKSDNENRQRFIIKYFGSKIDNLEKHLVFQSFEDVFKQELKNSNKLIYDWVSNFYYGDSRYKKEVDNFKEAKNPFEEDEISVDDLPF
jgi:uncharacterized protein (TIGR02391 family)